MRLAMVRVALLLPALLLLACGGEDYGEALCEARLRQPEPCEPNPCSEAIAIASHSWGPCGPEWWAATSTAPASYQACSDACELQHRCDHGELTVEHRTCGCQAACVREAPQEYRDAVAAYAACLEAETSVTSACF